jgi:cytochrome c oxidase subunit 4
MIRTYRNIFLALLVLLGLTVAASFVDLDRLLPGASLTVAMLIASAKALLVVMYFMHLRHGKRLTWAFAGAGFVWLAILLHLAMTDYATRLPFSP